MPDSEIICTQSGQRYTWDKTRLRRAELLYAKGGGRVVATIGRSAPLDRSKLNASLLAEEVVSSFALEGVTLRRQDMLSSLGGQLGIAETSIVSGSLADQAARAFVALSSRLDRRPTANDLRLWQALLSGEQTTSDDYFSNQIASLIHGLLDAPDLAAESTIARAGIAYLCLDSLFTSKPHGRCLLRGLVCRLLAADGTDSVFLGLSTILLRHKKRYALERTRVLEGCDITHWLLWIGAKALEAQREQLRQIEFRQFCIPRVASVQSMLNLRQKKMLEFMLDIGADVLNTGIKAGEYRRVTGASIATATRDLASLQNLRVLVRTGSFKWARYTYDAPIDIIREVSIEDIAL